MYYMSGSQPFYLYVYHRRSLKMFMHNLTQKSFKTFLLLIKNLNVILHGGNLNLLGIKKLWQYKHLVQTHIQKKINQIMFNV